MKKILNILVMLVLISLSNNAFSQLNINTTFTDDEFVKNIVGPNATASNITIRQASNACGLFINGSSSNIGLTRGVVLTSGDATNIPDGADGFANVTTGHDEGTGPGEFTTTDAQELAAIAEIESRIPSGAAYDYSIVQFDVVFNCTELDVKFVFGSEEYREWVNSAYNDAFGFFIHGGTYTNYDLAEEVIGSTPVTINTINHKTNINYYNDNETGQTIVYDGLTEVMNINASVSNSVTYTITIIIADGTDHILSSGVFLQYGSLGCGVGNSCYIDNFTYQQTKCNGSTYNLKGQIVLDNPPDADKLTVSDQLVVGGTPSTLKTIDIYPPFPKVIEYNIQNISLSNPGVSHELSVKFDIDPPSTICDLTIYYTNSIDCPSYCAISSVTATPSTCNIANNKYSVSGTITFDYVGPTDVGNLVVTDGNQVKQYDITEVLANMTETSPGSGIYQYNYTLYGLTSNGMSNKIKAYFAFIDDCYAESSDFTAPTSCFDVQESDFVECEDCITSFSPETGKEYLISAWVNQDETSPPQTTYNNVKVEVYYILDDLTEQYESPYSPSGQIIDGWQRISGTFTPPANAIKVVVRLVNTSTSAAYFDDIRIHPNDGSMKSYVYDPVSMRLVAELDENNYATFYEYNYEGKLVRVKKETERGIVTIQEQRNNQSQK